MVSERVRTLGIRDFKIGKTNIHAKIIIYEVQGIINANDCNTRFCICSFGAWNTTLMTTMGLFKEYIFTNLSHYSCLEVRITRSNLTTKKELVMVPLNILFRDIILVYTGPHFTQPYHLLSLLKIVAMSNYGGCMMKRLWK